ncbi:hypothetical protein C1X89_19620 [Pseudomonas sp. GP01-A8]|nr:hypothetical protein C1X90_24415 [Pseudomonas sp. GP01-A9]PMU26387.1 hypothetical protein C1X88_21765 [Pseudomonas sp. GP01-A13]PMU36652.1 hypothetical protein C1X89_19620 [Pseudomonas sp. GP01-A8]PMU47487.1 hypothetical protein C1X87_22405 [Pseudomonas sp. GP01-A14]PMU50011.1 hypothetical protein C1X85_25820 [Pseudomonas sp. GP01-A6]PMU60611.1 hypothetical protein C1X86_22590 [Pseudomonas sp. GP01-A3]PMU70194.1 hypothetical protein C1X81_21775 [Pseudomonas sp. FW215-L2]PMU70236.1 hypothe
MWERRCDDSTCSRRRCVSHRMHQLTHRFREQARSHIFDRISGQMTKRATIPFKSTARRDSS